MPIVDALQTSFDAKQIFYEDVVAFYLRYPEAMFRPDSPGFPVCPDDFKDAYQYALTLKNEFPNMTRGDDVGWQNFTIGELFTKRTFLPTQPQGPTQYKDLFGHLKTMQSRAKDPKFPNRPPFLRVNLKNILMRNLVYRNLKFVDTYEFMQYALWIPGYLPVGTLVFNQFTEDKMRYFNGPTPFFDETYFTFTQQDPMWKRFPYMLYAHQDICTLVPSRNTEKTYKQIFMGMTADFSKASTDVNLMYANLGNDYLSQNKVVVLKCFLHGHKAKPAIQTQLFSFYKSMEVVVDNDFSNEPLQYNYHLLQSADAALNNLGDVLTGNKIKTQTPPDHYNAVFQGFYTTLDKYMTVMRIDTFARSAMHEICRTHDVTIEAYPKICACIGRKDEITVMRNKMRNSMYRPICHEGDCLDDTEYKVFKYDPTLPCAPITVCDQNLNLGYTRNLTLKNVVFNCKFPVELSSSGSSLTPTSLTIVNDKVYRFTGLLLCVVIVFFIVVCVLLAKDPPPGSQ